MPKGEIHTLDTLVVSSLCAGGGPALGLGGEATGLLVFGALTGLVMNPDLDVDSGSDAFNVVRSLGGPVLAAIWRAFWFPYAKLASHRSFWSHFPVVSTFIRVVYLAVFIVPAVLGILSYLEWPRPELGQLIPLGYWFLGLVLSDTVHFVHDHLARRKA